jgi:pimeloyl-ACP methyl ester carboxylesterase
MPVATIEGIETHYEILGEGPPLLMFSPGGFDATLEKWSTLGIYAKTKPLDHLTRFYRCILFDRRECGRSGGAVGRVTWAQYAAQGKGLLDHLGIARAHLMGGCMGCSPVLNFALAYPEAVASMVLYWPVGGPKYRLNGQRRFTEHLAFTAEHGLANVAGLMRDSGKPFGADPRGGPWASMLKSDVAFAEAYAALDPDWYRLTVTGMMRTLFDRDTVPGAEPEDLMRCPAPALIIPGRDASHATSAAWYLNECLPNAEYWDAAPADQSATATETQLQEFLRKQPLAH